MTTMTTPLNNPASARRGAPWYREPYVWLVLAGPLAVVVASMFTIYLAVTRADPVLDRTPPPAVTLDAELLEKLSPEQRAALELSVTPAHKARNHVASPTVPKD
jgi:hypothetical protein